MMKEHHYSILFTKLQSELRIAFTNFQTLPDTFKSLVALSVRLEQNQWQLFSSTTLTKCNWSENDVKRANAEQQSKKLKNEEVLVSSQHREWTDDKSKKNVTCYQCNKKDHYKLQCSELAKEQPKNANQAPVGEMHVKGKDQHPQKILQVQSEEH